MFGFTPDPLGIDNVRSVHGRSGVDQIIVPAGHRVLLMGGGSFFGNNSKQGQPVCGTGVHIHRADGRPRA